MKINFLFLKNEELNIARSLYEKVFNDPKDFTDWFFENEAPKCRVFGGFLNDRLVSMMFFNPKKMVLNGRIIDAYYIYAVATDEAFRGMGIAKRMISEGIKELREESDSIFYLIPVDERIYNNMGFKTVRYKSVINMSQMKEDFLIREDYYWSKLRKNASKKVISEISDFALALSFLKDDILCNLYNVDYFERLISLYRIDGGGIYILRNKFDDNIKAIITTGIEDGAEKIIWVISEDDYMVDYLNDFYYFTDKKINDTLVINPVMIYDYKNALGENIGISLNDEV